MTTHGAKDLQQGVKISGMRLGCLCIQGT